MCIEGGMRGGSAALELHVASTTGRRARAVRMLLMGGRSAGRANRLSLTWVAGHQAQCQYADGGGGRHDPI